MTDGQLFSLGFQNCDFLQQAYFSGNIFQNFQQNEHVKCILKVQILWSIEALDGILTFSLLKWVRVQSIW